MKLTLFSFNLLLILFFFFLKSPTGLVYEGNVPLSVLNKNKITNQSENLQTDQTINDLAMDEYGNYLYIAAGNGIKIWDLKQ